MTLRDIRAGDALAARIRYTRSEAAHQLSISERQLDRLREAGKIIARVDGRHVFFDHSELTSYAKSCPAEGDE